MNLDDYDEALVSAVAKIEIERDELLLALERVLPFLTGNYWPGLAADPAVAFAIAAAKKARGRKAATMTPNVDVTGPCLHGSGGQQGSTAPEPSSGD